MVIPTLILNILKINFKDTRPNIKFFKLLIKKNKKIKNNLYYYSLFL